MAWNNISHVQPVSTFILSIKYIISRQILSGLNIKPILSISNEHIKTNGFHFQFKIAFLNSSIDLLTSSLCLRYSTFI